MSDFATPKFDRLKIILSLLREQSFVTQAQIAKVCSTSPKTAQRDIEKLRDRRWPIEKTNKGYYLRKASSAEKPSTIDEHFAVLMIAGCSIDKNISQLMPAVGEGVKREIFNMGEVEETESALLVDRAVNVPKTIYSKDHLRLFGKLSRNIIDELAITFKYRSVGYSEEVVRTVYPVQLKLKEGIWYLLGFDLKHKESRIYAFNKIGEVSLLKEPWKPPTAKNIEQILQVGEFSIWDNGKDKIKVQIDVSGYAQEYLFNQKLSDDQTCLTKGAISKVTFTTTDFVGTLLWCRRFAPDVKIIRPKELRETFIKDLQYSLALNIDQ